MTSPPTPQAHRSPEPPLRLVKGQRLSLNTGDAGLTSIMMGLGWDPVRREGHFGDRAPDIDLDASAVLFADGQIADIAYYGQLISKDGSVRHQGDNLTGAGDGDDEVLIVELSRIPVHVTTILFIVTSYQGQTFEQIDNTFCRLVDQSTGTELARYTLAGGMPYTGVVMARVWRDQTTPGASDWTLEALGDGISARHPGEAAPQLLRFLP
ncbi:TerD family protein [Jongsikchunia kroppenstedtii]|uniref:TerD family protein n=1 Tax=Jongsikchunia kroppenstedtii TaxID=1121721 RepID=UPI000376A228